jgi:hypothetical protein
VKLTAAFLAATIALGCASAPPLSSESPAVDTSALQQLLDDAIAEAQRAADTAAVELPATLAETLEQNGIDLPTAPTNAREICDALGTPDERTSASSTLRSLIESFVAGGEVGLVIGLLTAVVFTTCPIWSPHIETAVDQVL